MGNIGQFDEFFPMFLLVFCHHLNIHKTCKFAIHRMKYGLEVWEKNFSFF